MAGAAAETQSRAQIPSTIHSKHDINVFIIRVSIIQNIIISPRSGLRSSIYSGGFEKSRERRSRAASDRNRHGINYERLINISCVALWNGWRGGGRRGSSIIIQGQFPHSQDCGANSAGLSKTARPPGGRLTCCNKGVKPPPPAHNPVPHKRQ